MVFTDTGKVVVFACTGEVGAFTYTGEVVVVVAGTGEGGGGR